MFAECAGDSDEVVETDVSFTAFNPTDVGRMKTCSFGKFLLRPTPCKPQLPNGLSDADSMSSIHVS